MVGNEVPQIDLLPETLRPDWFVYPEEFLRLASTGLAKFPPWRLLEGRFAASRMQALRQRFPTRELVPFAVRLDCDDVACWERGKSGVTVIHDFASPGWENRPGYDTFWDWFRSAIEDFIEFES